VRNVPELLVAAWQHHVASGSVQTLDDWARAALQEDGTVRMGGLDALREDDGTSLVARWADAVGAANMTVVVERRGGRDTLAALAALTGLGRDAVPAAAPARALTAPETELVRLFNATLPYRTTVPTADRRRFVRRGAVAGLVAGDRPGDDAPVTLPQWAIEPARAAGRRLEAQLLERGVVVVGESAVLSSDPQEAQTGTGTSTRTGTELHRSSVEAALLGMFDAAVRRPVPAPPAPRVAKPAPAPTPEPPLDALPVRALLSEIVRRTRTTHVRTGSGEVS
jgi:hypothetical protein